MLTPGLLILEIQRNPLYVVSIIFTVIVGITLHELAHGFAAIGQGDRTPIELGRMTPNPIVHMPPFAFVLLAVAGIAFGSMPINSARFRSRFGEAIVAAAGPAMNLGIALLALTVLGIWVNNADPAALSLRARNAQDVLWWFGLTNIVLTGFNLIPLPPLDGSRILANFSSGYRHFITHRLSPEAAVFAFLAVFVGLSYTDYAPFNIAADIGNRYLELFSTR
jgi:Zn-dependent protease